MTVLIILNANLALSEEPGLVLILKNRHVHSVSFSSLKKQSIKTVNQHPNYLANGLVEYSGYLTKDILQPFTTKEVSDQEVLILGETGKYSTSIAYSDLVSKNNLIATDLNGKKLDYSNSGNQIIYSLDSQNENQELKHRNYWCWWVRMFILDDMGFELITNNVFLTKESEYKSGLPFPKPYGKSSKTSRDDFKSLGLKKVTRIDKGSSMTLTLLNGRTFKVALDPSFDYFIGQGLHKNYGINILLVSSSKGQVITNIFDSYFYIKEIKIEKTT